MKKSPISLLVAVSMAALLSACQQPASTADTAEQAEDASASTSGDASSTAASASDDDALKDAPAADARGGAAVDKSSDTVLTSLQEDVIPKFQQLSFHDEATGKTMEYNLYTPEDIDENPDKTYPLVMFIADASTVGKGVTAPLTQGYGGLVWASDADQAKNPAFVLVPAFTGPEAAVNDQSEAGEEVGTALRLLKQVISTQPIDTDRVYATGQSMGGMISFYLNITEPDLFAASLFVGSQWDTSVLLPLKDRRFVYAVAAGDPKASQGMADLKALFNDNDIAFAATEFAANAPQSEQDAQASALLAQDNPHNFITFTEGSTLPEGVSNDSPAGEHMTSFDYAYRLTPVREWLLAQHK